MASPEYCPRFFGGGEDLQLEPRRRSAESRRVMEPVAPGPRGKTNGCSSAAAATPKRNADGGFLSVLTQAVPSRAELSCAVLAHRPAVRAWSEGGAPCGLKP